MKQKIGRMLPKILSKIKKMNRHGSKRMEEIFIPLPRYE
jgi:hypothetical protein